MLLGIVPVGLAQQSRSFVNIVGAQAAYRFLSQVVERFGETTIYKYPLIEATGDEAGITMFCLELAVETPDILMLDRRMRLEEYARCARNGVGELIEMFIGFEAVVIVSGTEMPPLDLDLGELFLALAATVPNPSNPQEIVENPHRRWQAIHSRLPDAPISILGPPTGSALERLLAQRGLALGCQRLEAIQALAETNPVEYRQVCHRLREDTEIYEPVSLHNDELLEQLLNNPSQLALTTYGFLQDYRDDLRHVLVDSIPPSVTVMQEHRYPLARPLYVYLKVGHLQLIPGLREFAEELVSEETVGRRGYLRDLGLVTLPPPDLEALIRTVELMSPMEPPTPTTAEIMAEAGTDEEVPPEDPVLTLDLAAWEAVKNSENILMFQLYLEKFPEGQFLEMANRRLEELQTAAAEAAAVAEDIEALEDDSGAGDDG